MDPKALAILDPLPSHWPKMGTFRGHPIDLNVARATLDVFDLASVVVDVPGVGPMQPWKGSDILLVDGKVKI